ncbi:MAG TPA: prepilin-type N-terminal cleavage/methylation domain-containing protein [Longimicrobium sp.]|nr:prepilin-type N-terminal cleavage/methylation domain-containing protein [Longimicrobium sp.]
MRTLQNKKGFTLIELMIVVVIIGILAAIAIPRFSQVSNRAKQAEAGPILKQICSLAQTYWDQKDADAGDIDDLVEVGFDANNKSGKYFDFTYSAGEATADAKVTAVSDTSMDCGDAPAAAAAGA